MKLLIVYDTFYGNTQKVAELVKEQFHEHDAELIRIDVITQDHIDSADLIIVGTPTRAFNMTKKIKKMLRKYHFENKKFWVFDTRANMDDIDSKFLMKLINRFGYAAEKMETRLLKKGGVKAKDYSYYFVKDVEGPLYEEVANKIKDDVKELLD